MKEPIALVAVALASLLSIAAAADSREDFKRAYGEYQQHMAAGDEALALPAAETAYETGTVEDPEVLGSCLTFSIRPAWACNALGPYCATWRGVEAHHQRLVDLHFVDGDEVLNY